MTALAAGYAMAGDIDEVGIFSYALAPGEAMAIHSLASEPQLKYTLAQVNQLIELSRGKEGRAEISGRTWRYYATGLSSQPGRLAKDGAGVSTR